MWYLKTEKEEELEGSSGRSRGLPADMPAVAEKFLPPFLKFLLPLLGLGEWPLARRTEKGLDSGRGGVGGPLSLAGRWEGHFEDEFPSLSLPPSSLGVAEPSPRRKAAAAAGRGRLPPSVAWEEELEVIVRAG